VLSDSGLLLAGQLGLPTFEAGDRPRYKRLTLVINGGQIEHVFYPVFPPDKHAAEVLAWLQQATA
jgi:peroxiredoxin